MHPGGIARLLKAIRTTSDARQASHLRAKSEQAASACLSQARRHFPRMDRGA